MLQDISEAVPVVVASVVVHRLVLSILVGGHGGGETDEGISQGSGNG